MFNPLDKENLGKSVSDALLAQETLPLSSLSAFRGAGIYAIYFDVPEGSLYKGLPFNIPVYVGKAIPKGGRKGLSVDSANSLFDRLGKHLESLSQARDLNVDQFYYKRLVVDDIWIPLGETLIISHFKPVWNLVIDGFGNNDPGVRRATQYRSKWDTLHPGRKWAEKLASRKEPQAELQELLVMTISQSYT